MHKFFLVVFSCLIFLNLIEGQTIDTEKSVVNFKTTALMVNTVRGTFKGMNGDIQFDENNLSDSKFKVCIDPASVNTDNQKRDDHLKSDDFFGIENYLEICFESTSIKKTKDGFETTGNFDNAWCFQIYRNSIYF